MGRSRIIFALVGLASVLALVVLWLQPRVEKALAPEPHTAHVAIEVDGSDVAVVGRVETLAGTGFRLHAVLEATARNGEAIFYSEAQALEIGGDRVPNEQIRRWNRPQEAKVLWFTVEATSPFAKLDSGQGLERVRYEEFFHPDWSTLWQIDGNLDPRHAEILAGSEEATAHFGTQRFRTWVEIFEPVNPLVPAQRFRSLGAEDLRDRVADFPTVTATLPGSAAAVSAVFGLVGVELPSDASPELRSEVADQAARRLLFTRVSVLREALRLAGAELDELPWRNIELVGRMSWGVEVRQGDLLRVGARLVMLHEDRDGDGQLGGADSCLDFDEGAAVRRLDEVFPGEGEIEWASLQT